MTLWRIAWYRVDHTARGATIGPILWEAIVSGYDALEAVQSVPRTREGLLGDAVCTVTKIAYEGTP